MPGPDELLKEVQKQQEVMREKTSLADAMQQTYQRRNVEAVGQGDQPELVHDTKKSFSILKKCKKFLFPASAGSSAEGLPAVEEHKEKTWKDKRADEAHAEKAKNEAQDYHADEYSYKIMESLKERDKSETASLEMYKRTIPNYDELRAKNKVDVRVIRAFAGTYKVDEKGMPVDQENAELMDKERKLMEDYVSGDLEKRKPILENLVKELMDKRIEPSMLNIDYVSEHIVELKNIGDKMIYLENIMNDEINKPFFEEMEPVEKEMLECTISIADVYTGYLDQLLKIRAVNMNHHAYIKGEADNIEAINMLTEEFKSRFESKMAQRAVNQQKVYEKYYGESVRKLIKDCANPNPDLSGKMDETQLEKYHSTFTTKREVIVDATKNLKGVETRIEQADRLFDRSMEKNDFSEADSMAKQTLGIRESTQDTAQADKALKGTIFKTLLDDYKSFNTKLGAEDLPFDQMEQTMKTKTFANSAAKVVSGGGTEAIAMEMLSMFKQRVLTPECMKYLYEGYKAMGSAKIFGVKGEEARLERVVSFQLQCLINTHGAAGFVGTDGNTPFGRIVKEASRNTLGIYRLSEDITKEQEEKLKEEDPGLYELLTYYRDMADEVLTKLKQFIAGKEAAAKAAGAKGE